MRVHLAFPGSAGPRRNQPIPIRKDSGFIMDPFDSYLTAPQLEIMQSLDSPYKIQAFLDGCLYPASEDNRCPLRVLEDRTAHCLDGALFAAAALHRLGHQPRLVDLRPEPEADDDHLLAIFQVDGRYGALAKSNFTGLRMREPVYRGLRELVMSYFEGYFNVNGQKTLRGYTRPFNLASLRGVPWMTSDLGADAVEQRLYDLKVLPLVSDRAAALLSPVDPISYRAGMLVVNQNGLFKPKES
jgi:hypothetical protein